MSEAPEGVKAWQRVVVVVNWRRGTVHGITGDNAEAQRWTRELIDQYGDPLVATQTAWVVDASEVHAAGREAAAQAVLDAAPYGPDGSVTYAEAAEIARGGR